MVAKTASRAAEVPFIRTRLQMLSEVRDLALFNLAIDSKLRASDLVAISVDDVFDFRKGSCRVIIIQRRPADPCNSN